MIGGWKKLDNGDIQNVYSSPCDIKVIRQKRLWRTEYAARTGNLQYAYKGSVGNPDGKGPPGDLHTWEIILVLSKLPFGFVWLRIWKMAAVENTVINIMGS